MVTFKVTYKIEIRTYMVSQAASCGDIELVDAYLQVRR
jgi:hypothetical protein